MNMVILEKNIGILYDASVRTKVEFTIIEEATDENPFVVIETKPKLVKKYNKLLEKRNIMEVRNGQDS